MTDEEKPECLPAANKAVRIIKIVDYDPRWPEQFEAIAGDLRAVLNQVPLVGIEHIGSTSVPGLAAKPIIDVDVIVQAANVLAATDALIAAGYHHLGDLGLEGREAFEAPDNDPERHVYLCTAGTLHLRNHLAIRDALRSDAALRDAYSTVKRALVAQASMDIDRYTEGKSDILQAALMQSGISNEEKAEIRRVNEA